MFFLKPTVDGCEILNEQLIGGLSVPIIYRFSTILLVVQDFAGPSTVSPAVNKVRIVGPIALTKAMQRMKIEDPHMARIGSVESHRRKYRH